MTFTTGQMAKMYVRRYLFYQYLERDQHSLKY